MLEAGWVNREGAVSWVPSQDKVSPLPKSKRVAASATPVSYLFRTGLATGRAEGLAFKQGGERHLAA